MTRSSQYSGVQTRPASVALLLAGHGSRAASWQAAFEGLREQVACQPGLSTIFQTVTCGFVEHTKPALADAARALLTSGGDHPVRIVAVPVFLTVSRHAGEDVPGLLGQPVADHVLQRLRGEGHRPLTAGLPVSIAPLGDPAELLALNVLDRLAGATPSQEAVVLCGYGSSVHHDRWERLMGDVKQRLMSAGFSYAAHAYVGHTAHPPHARAQSAIERAAGMAGVRRVRVVPLLLAVGLTQTQVIQAAVDGAQVPDGVRVSYACDSVLPSPRLARQIAQVALRHEGIIAVPSGMTPA